MNSDEKAKLNALRMFDSGLIDSFEIGTKNSLIQIHQALFNGLSEYQPGCFRKTNISKDGMLFASTIYLDQAITSVQRLPQDKLEHIIEKYVEMNIVHPFVEGNGRATRIWLDLILKKELSLCICWDKIEPQEYLFAMRKSVSNVSYLEELLKGALTDDINNRILYMRGIEQSFIFEGAIGKSIFQLDQN